MICYTNSEVEIVKKKKNENKIFIFIPYFDVPNNPIWNYSFSFWKVDEKEFQKMNKIKIFVDYINKILTLYFIYSQRYFHIKLKMFVSQFLLQAIKSKSRISTDTYKYA